MGQTALHGGVFPGASVSPPKVPGLCLQREARVSAVWLRKAVQSFWLRHPVPAMLETAGALLAKSLRLQPPALRLSLVHGLPPSCPISGPNRSGIRPFFAPPTRWRAAQGILVKPKGKSKQNKTEHKTKAGKQLREVDGVRRGKSRAILFEPALQSCIHSLLSQGLTRIESRTRGSCPPGCADTGGREAVQRVLGRMASASVIVGTEWGTGLLAPPR